MATATRLPVSRSVVELIVRQVMTQLLARPTGSTSPTPAVHPAQLGATDGDHQRDADRHGPGSGALASQAAPPLATETGASRQQCFYSPEAEALKAEIVAVGRKLWQRQYVDGNGGNISCRLGEDMIICTPALLSKADLTVLDLCLVDLEGSQLLGTRAATSETPLHLEIYKAVPEARAVVHCHAPHATAYAITGCVPPACVIPEYEVFVGSVALSPYETPGTQQFAETVLPFVRKHNTVLLANHGIVCWADTVTHAEWCAEVIDTYCWTLMLAAQLGAPIQRIPPDKMADLLAVKQQWGLPDARLDSSARARQHGDMPELPGAVSLPSRPAAGPDLAASDRDLEAVVQAITDAVLAALGASGQ